MAKNKNRKKEKKKRNASNPDKSPVNPFGGYSGIVRGENNMPGQNGEDF